MTNPHNFTLDGPTEKIYKEFQDLVRKDGRTVSELFRRFIIVYVESRNAKVVRPVKNVVTPYPNLKRLTRKMLNPHRKGTKNFDIWDAMYAKVP